MATPPGPDFTLADCVLGPVAAAGLDGWFGADAGRAGPADPAPYPKLAGYAGRDGVQHPAVARVLGETAGGDGGKRRCRAG